MWTLAAGLWAKFMDSKFAKYAAIAGAFLIALFVAFAKTFSAGKAANEAKHTAAELKARQKAKETENEVDGMGDDDRYDAGNRWL